MWEEYEREGCHNSLLQQQLSEDWMGRGIENSSWATSLLVSFPIYEFPDLLLFIHATFLIYVYSLGMLPYFGSNVNFSRVAWFLETSALCIHSPLSVAIQFSNWLRFLPIFHACVSFRRHSVLSRLVIDSAARESKGQLRCVCMCCLWW